MDIRLNTTPVCLVKDQTLSVIDAKGSLINCHRGTLWITQDNDRRDIVLTPGESFTFDRDGQAIVSALDDSSIEVLPASRPRRTVMSLGIGPNARTRQEPQRRPRAVARVRQRPFAREFVSTTDVGPQSSAR